MDINGKMVRQGVQTDYIKEKHVMMSNLRMDISGGGQRSVANSSANK